jgi:phosphoglycerate dehydrogenase-like enzyme
MKKILVTPRSLTREGHPALDLLKDAGYQVIFSTPGKQPDEGELLRLLPECVGMLAGVEKISANVLKAAKDLQVISRNGVGIDNIDGDTAERLNIKIMRTVGANSRGVAELAIGFLFCGIRFIPYSDGKMKAGEWSRKKGIEIYGRTLGLIGCGQIGKIVTQMALGLGIDVIAYDLYPDTSFDPSPNFTFLSFDEVLERSDVLSLHCPAPQDGKPVIDKAAIALMKKGSYLINTARAALIDAEAVLEGLQSGQLAGFATDVYPTEPPQASPLLSHENVITTPHIGGFTLESVNTATRMAVENLLECLQG